MYYFINAFFEIDNSDNRENEKALRKCGNYFPTRAKALETLCTIKNCIKDTPESIEKTLVSIGFKADKNGGETTYSLNGGEDKELYVIVTHKDGAINYSVEAKNHIFHYEGMFNYMFELKQVLEVCAIKVAF